MAFVRLSSIILIVLIISINAQNISINSDSVESDSVGAGVQHSEDNYVLEINNFCDINVNCSHNTICIDNYCRCNPNHRWNEWSHSCESYNCGGDENQCKVDDRHRECTHRYPSVYFLFKGQCECQSGYYEDRRSRKCLKFCHNNDECDPQPFTNFTNNKVCVDFLCQCRPNFRWNSTTSSCEPFVCTKDSDCWTNADENRECYEGVCQCNFQEDLETTKCYLSLYSLFRFKNYSTRKERILLCTIFIIPAVLFCCAHSYFKKRRQKRLMANLSKQQLSIIYSAKDQQIKNTYNTYTNPGTKK